MTLFSFGADRPEVHESAHVDDSATVIGKVRLGPHANLWRRAVATTVS